MTSGIEGTFTIKRLTMFEFLKSAKTLEQELRTWLIAEKVRISGESSREGMTQWVMGMALAEVLKDAGESALCLKGEGNMMRMMIGERQPASVVKHWSKGLTLVGAAAKASGHQIECKGGDAVGYTCSVK